MTFTAPTADQVLAMQVNAGIEQLATSERFAAATPDLVAAIAEGIGQLAAGDAERARVRGASPGVLAPPRARHAA